MIVSRREFIRVAGLGLVAAALAANDTRALAQAQVQPPYSPGPSAYQASTAERALQIVNLDLLEAEAKRVLPEAGYVFVAGGSGDEWTLRENRRAFHDFPILPQRLAGIGDKDIDLRVSLLGHDLSYPILVAPMGAQAMVHERAEAATAAGTGAAGALYESSGASTRPLEEIARATRGRPSEPAPRPFRSRTMAGGSLTACPPASACCPPSRMPWAARYQSSSTAACAGASTCSAPSLGANAVAVGRPILYGLAVGGSEGVRSVLEFLRGELKTAMLLAGVGRVGDVKRTHVVTMSACSRAGER